MKTPVSQVSYLRRDFVFIQVRHCTSTISASSLIRYISNINPSALEWANSDS
jgi:hypothetical protein